MRKNEDNGKKRRLEKGLRERETGTRQDQVKSSYYYNLSINYGTYLGKFFCHYIVHSIKTELSVIMAFI